MCVQGYRGVKLGLGLSRSNGEGEREELAGILIKGG